MVDEILMRRWQNTHWHLSAAREIAGSTLATRGNDQTHERLLSDFSEFLQQNELELALSQLELLGEKLLGEKNRLKGNFWLHLAMAARCMNLSERYESAIERFQTGIESKRELEEIAECAERELTDQRLGVTEQFFAVHQPDPKGVVHVFADGDRGRAWVRIQGEDYYWVVNTQRIPSGTWSVEWGRAGHQARVYLAIYSDVLSPDEISDQLGFSPTRSNWKGAKISKRPENQRRFDSQRLSARRDGTILRCSPA